MHKFANPVFVSESQPLGYELAFCRKKVIAFLKKKSHRWRCGLHLKALSAASGSGFTLIELLVVIAVIGIMAGLMLPAFNTIGQARGVSSAAYQLAGAIELARSEAVTRRTYVWLGLLPQTNSGNVDLRVGMVYSKDRTTNSDANNLQPLSRPVLLERVGITNPSTLSVGANIGSPVDWSASTTGLGNFTCGSVSFGNGKTITFSPTGEVGTNASPTYTNAFNPRIGIGLRQMRGNSAATNNDIAIVIDGSVGIPTIYQKK